LGVLDELELLEREIAAAPGGDQPGYASDDFDRVIARARRCR